MLTKTQAAHILRKRLGDAFRVYGFKWSAAAYGFWRSRPNGADGFMVPQVNYGDEQKISFVMSARLDRVEEIRCEASGEPGNPWLPTLLTSLDWFESRFYVQWSCKSPEELERAIDELLAKYKPRILDYWERYADPVNVLHDADERRGPVELLRPETIRDAITGLILQWVYQREGFERRLVSYGERLASADAVVLAPLERVVAWLRNHPEQTSTA